jgi:hypothetical protein
MGVVYLTFHKALKRFPKWLCHFSFLSPLCESENSGSLVSSVGFMWPSFLLAVLPAGKCWLGEV